MAGTRDQMMTGQLCTRPLTQGANTDRFSHDHERAARAAPGKRQMNHRGLTSDLFPHQNSILLPCSRPKKVVAQPLLKAVTGGLRFLAYAPGAPLACPCHNNVLEVSHNEKNYPVTGHEPDFASDAIILSTTDLKGRITYCNKDFIDVSGFTENELYGKAHNIVRHPDMPPLAFADLWSNLKAGKNWMGMVKNRCKNGDHYWVNAYAMPILENGTAVEYQSVRTKPTREQIQRAERLYPKLMEERLPLATRLPALTTTRDIDHTMQVARQLEQNTIQQERLMDQFRNSP